MINTKSGTGEEFAANNGYGIGANDLAVTDTTPKEQPVVTDTGDYVFFDGKNNEGATSFEPKQPGDKVPDWIRSVEEKVLYGIGWHLALISPNSIGSYAARIMESQVQQMNVTRQATLKRVASLYCISAIAKAIENKDLPMPKNNADWRNIDFHMPPEFQIDSYYGAQTAMQQWEKGNNTLANITAKQGMDWVDIRNQREIETEDACTRVERLKAKHPWLTEERALDQITKQTVNAAPVQSTPQDTTTNA